MGPQRGGVDDLATLPELDDHILLEELFQRYRQDVIYTYIGDILLSINPYRLLPVYGDEIGHRYGCAKSLTDLRPHVYALGSRAYHNMQRQQGNQCLLVSGESGAGKTEVSKMLVSQILRMCPRDDQFLLQKKIIEVNPLLEAFGNAQTLMNDNSSRFGKLIELVFFPTGQVAGARITEHMLEKSRVVRQGQGEKNFHIFYNMMAGFTTPERKRYFLEAPERYRILDPGHGVPVIGSEMEFSAYVEAMDNVRRIMPMVGFTDQDMDVVFALLAAILHLCNIELAVEPESEEVIVMNEEEIDYAAVLLSVQPEDLVSCLLANITWVRGERLIMIKSLNQACDGRDAVAKALYSKLFSWIVQQVNFMLHEEENRDTGYSSTISILDMAGFENFPSNSFEQLCINSANERLQHYFNEHIFHLELQEYQAEGIKQPRVKFTNNTEILSLFFQRPMGLFTLLEEECRLAKATDLSFVEKLNKQFSKQDLYGKSKQRAPVFSIMHYAGQVVYRAQGILEKNRDTLSSNMQSLMENSQNNLVNELFTATVLDTGTLDMRQGSMKSKWGRPDWHKPEKRSYAPGDSLSRQAGRKLRQRMKDAHGFQDIGITSNPNSASAHFKNSLQLLMDKLKVAEPHFIRCFKPNNRKAPSMFDNKCVQEQLVSTGVLETTRIRRLGYPTRLPFHVFFHRYKFLAFPMTAPIEPGPGSCIEVLKACRIQDAQIGNNKVFLKYRHVDHLSASMDGLLSDIVHVQSLVRTFLARRAFRYQAQRMKWEESEIDTFSTSIMKSGDTIFYILRNQADHDSNRLSRRDRYADEGWRNDRQGRITPGTVDDHPDYSPPPSRQTRNGGLRDVFMSPEVTGHSNKSRSLEAFKSRAVGQVLDKLEEIDPDVWCKILYMEYDKPVAKFYICDREITIDGSHDEFSGSQIGLGAFRNSDRDEKTERIRSYIGKGLSLKKDSDGSILATRLGKNEVIVRGYEDPANQCLSADIIQEAGLVPLNRSIKVFDIEQLKSHIGIEMRSEEQDEERLQLLSVFCVSFIREEEEALATPCWLCVINIMALDAINNPEVWREIQQRFAELSLGDKRGEMEKQVLQEVAGRYHRNWSKLNPRQGVQKKDPLRKTRLQIKQKGENVGDRMDYSWQEKAYGDGINRQRNISEIQEEYDRFDGADSVFATPGAQGTPGRAPSIAASSVYTDIKSSRKDWAKIRVGLKQERIQEGEELQRARPVDDY